MTNQNLKNQNTLNALIAKNNGEHIRIPSISKIHNLLSELNIKHIYRETSNTVEHRNNGSRYVNERREGKVGREIIVELEHKILHLDSSDSYYSWNTYRYARELIELINNR